MEVLVWHDLLGWPRPMVEGGLQSEWAVVCSWEVGKEIIRGQKKREEQNEHRKFS